MIWIVPDDQASKLRHGKSWLGIKWLIAAWTHIYLSRSGLKPQLCQISRCKAEVKIAAITTASCKRTEWARYPDS